MSNDASAALIARLRGELGPRVVHDDPGERWAYGADNSRIHAQPGVVIVPEHPDQVAAALRICHETRTPVTARGLGSATTGAAVPAPGGAVISFEQMRRIQPIDRDNRVVVVEAGATNGDVQRAAASAGFFWAPDPTSADYSTVGGNLACNAAGPRAVKYGTARENTLGLRAVTGDGTCIRTGVYTTKGVVGYDLTRLIVGSEGTLALITEATLKLTPSPEAVRTIRVGYADVASAAAAVSRIMAQPVVPCVLEFMDPAATGLVRDETRLDSSIAALLLIEVDGFAAHLDDYVAAVRQAADGPGLVEFRAARDATERTALWAARRALSPALRRLAPRKINEDVVVPVSRIAALVDRLGELANRFGVTIVSFGHAGNGNLHVNLLGDHAEGEPGGALRQCLEEVFATVLALGGTLSGEHGVGMEKRPYIGLEIEPATLALMRAIKANFDPHGILNPGKVF